MKNFYCFFFAFAAILALIAGCKKNDYGLAGKSFAVSLQPGPANGKDACVEDYPYENYRNSNWGNTEEFAAISWTDRGIPFVVRSFIDFNFDTIPSNAVIDSAKLSLFAYGNVGHGYGHDPSRGSNECFLQRVVGAWEEHLITWNAQPAVTEVNKVYIQESEYPMQDYLEIDVTYLVKDIISDKENSYGFMLRLVNETGYRRMFFATSDVEEKQKRPRLDIYYTAE